MRGWVRAAVLAGLIAAMAPGCGKPNVAAPPAAVVQPEEAPVPPQTEGAPLPGRGEVRIDGRSQGPVFQVELARTDAERNRGLMFRHRLDDDRGMLFFMPGDDDWQFWMKNTYLHLDMVFIDAEWNVVGVLDDVPPLTEDHRSCGKPSRYVLELAAHVAKRQGIATGTHLQFRGLADAARTP